MKIIDKICEKTRLDKKTVSLLFIGIIGILLLVVSGLAPEKEEAVEKTEKEAAGYDEYVKIIEAELESLISSIKGAGKTKVMITLDSTEENTYLSEEKSSDSQRESKVVVIETEEGEDAVLVKITQPKIRGVAVVCSGADSDEVKKSIMDTVTAVLDISAARVNIATMKTDNGG